MKNGIAKYYKYDGTLEKEIHFENGNIIKEELIEKQKQEAAKEVKPELQTPVKESSNLRKTVNYVSLSAASIIIIYVLYTIIIYLAG